MGLIERYRSIRVDRRTFMIGAGIGAFGALVAACSGSGQEQEKNGFQSELSTPESINVQITPKREVEDGLIESPRAVLNLGNWEIAVVGWEEPELDPTSFDLYNLKGNIAGKPKAVAVELIARNTSNRILDSELVGDLSKLYGYRLTDADGRFQGESWVYPYIKLGGGTLSSPYFRNAGGSLDFVDRKYVLNESFLIPPGFSLSIGILFFVPEDLDDYGLAIVPLQPGLPDPNKVFANGDANSADKDTIVKRGEVALNYKLVSNEAIVRSTAEPFIFQNPKTGETYQMNLLNEETSTYESSGVRAQLLDFRVQNVSDFDYSGGFIEDERDFLVGEAEWSLVQVTAYLKDGRVIPAIANDQVASLDRGNFLSISVPVAADGPVKLEQYPEDDARLYGRVDLSGSVVVVAVKDQGYFAWQLP